MLFGTSVLAIVSGASASPAASPVPLKMSFSAPVDKVYAALVRAAGVGLKTTVKDACVVNFEATRNKLLYFDISASCRDIGSGQTLLVLNIQRDPRSEQVFRTGGERDKFLQLFWADMDAWLKVNGAPSSESIPEQAASPPRDDLATTTVKSTPEGAEITVDGKFSGNAPATLRLPAGDHTIRIVSKGFQTWERTMTVTSGGMTTISATLEPER
jgi:PEGA domain